MTNLWSAKIRIGPVRIQAGCFKRRLNLALVFCVFIMAALCNRAGHYIFALWFLSIFYLSFFFIPCLISAVADWMSAKLRRWTEGATYIRQGGHRVGHWPTILVLCYFCVFGILCVLVFWIIVLLCCQYQCSWLPGMTVPEMTCYVWSTCSVTQWYETVGWLTGGASGL